MPENPFWLLFGVGGFGSVSGRIPQRHRRELAWWKQVGLGAILYLPVLLIPGLHLLAGMDWLASVAVGLLIWGVVITVFTVAAGLVARDRPS